MLNLLPPKLTEQYVYARRNTRLRRWIGIGSLALVGLAAIISFGLFSLQGSINNYNHQLATSKGPQIEAQLKDLQKQSTDITNNVRLVVTVLSKEVLFSQLLKQIATVTPAKAKLTQLSIANTQGGVDITADAADYQTATQLQVNLQAPGNNIFSKADIQSITCGTSTSDPNYPCSVIIRALFTKDNPYLFIHKDAK
jgi:Tfp pilus assembly protein PilN